MSRMSRAITGASSHATQILLRNVPKTVTSRDIRRALANADVRGVAKVELNYTHFRPNGKATLTMEVPEYTSEALQQANSLMISGIQVIAEPIYDSLSNHAMARPLFGDGPSAGAFPFDTVSIAGVPGKTRVSEVQKMLSGFNVVNIKSVPLPPRKFSLYGRFIVNLKSESEAQRLVRKLHMTRFKGVESAPIIRVEMIV